MSLKRGKRERQRVNNAESLTEEGLEGRVKNENGVKVREVRSCQGKELSKGITEYRPIQRVNSLVTLGNKTFEPKIGHRDILQAHKFPTNFIPTNQPSILNRITSPPKISFNF